MIQPYKKQLMLLLDLLLSTRLFPRLLIPRSLDHKGNAHQQRFKRYRMQLSFAHLHCLLRLFDCFRRKNNINGQTLMERIKLCPNCAKLIKYFCSKILSLCFEQHDFYPLTLVCYTFHERIDNSLVFIRIVRPLISFAEIFVLDQF